MIDLLVWPSVALVAYFGTVFTFRNSFRSFLDNAKSVQGPGGIKIDRSPQAQVATDPEVQALPAAAAVEPAPQHVAADARLPDAGPLVVQVEETVRKELDERSPNDNVAQLELTVRALALARIMLAHEANYRVIFSTQIMLLKAVNDKTIQDTKQAQYWYGIFHNRLPDVPITFDAWLGFLENCGYIVVGERVAGRPSSLAIDPFGRDFLFWMIQHGISEIRPG